MRLWNLTFSLRHSESRWFISTLWFVARDVSIRLDIFASSLPVVIQGLPALLYPLRTNTDHLPLVGRQQRFVGDFERSRKIQEITFLSLSLGSFSKTQGHMLVSPRADPVSLWPSNASRRPDVITAEVGV